MMFKTYGLVECGNGGVIDLLGQTRHQVQNLRHSVLSWPTHLHNQSPQTCHAQETEECQVSPSEHPGFYSLDMFVHSVRETILLLVESQIEKTIVNMKGANGPSLTSLRSREDTPGRSQLFQIYFAMAMPSLASKCQRRGPSVSP